MSDVDLIQKHHVEFSCSAHNQAMDIIYSDEQTPEENLQPNRAYACCALALDAA